MQWPISPPTHEKKNHEILAFDQYLQLLQKNPYFHTRPSYQYLIDMLKHGGKTESGQYRIFTKDHYDSPPVFGQGRAQENLFQNLINFREEGSNNKFILLVGPNGSSKTTLVRKLMKGTEEYSQTEEGALYTFSWIFPIDNFVKGHLGIATERKDKQVDSYAELEDKDITAILPSELKDHPLLLVPSEFRKQLLDQALTDNPGHLELIKKSYLYNGELSKRNKMIYEALLKNYKGNHQSVLKHIRIERFYISRRYSSGAVTIEPQLHVDASMQQITMDRRLALLPPSLQSLNLFSLQGEVILANRGILEFSDLLKRPLDAFKYLLMTIETGSINIQGILTDLDIFFIGTSNEVHLQAFKQHPDFNSFKGRFNFITVPYLLDYRDEEKIYQKQIDGLKNICHFGPQSLTTLALFTVMTRLRSPHPNNYSDEKLGKAISSFAPLEKCFFLADKNAIPERFDSEAMQILKQGHADVLSEYDNDTLYEGKFGLSPRDVKRIIYRLASKNHSITFIDILEYLKKLIRKKNDYDFLNIPMQGDYHNSNRFLEQLKEYFLDIFDRQLRDCLGLVDDRSYEDYIKRYIQNINAMIKNEKMKNTITGKFEAPDQFFIKEFEINIKLNESTDSFRSHLLTRLGAYSLDNPGKEIIYTDVFPDLERKLKESFREEQKKTIVQHQKNLVYFEAKLHGKTKGMAIDVAEHQLSKEGEEQIQKILNNLQKQYGHSQIGALTTMKYLLKERY